jgi:hypothetical protein
MTLDDDIKYDANTEHPHIADDGTVTEEGRNYALREFERREREEGVASSMEFYNRLEPEAQTLIYKKYKFEFLNRKTCRHCSQYMR